MTCECSVTSIAIDKFQTCDAQANLNELITDLAFEENLTDLLFVLA